MQKTNQHRSCLMQMLRMSPGPLLLACAVGVVLMTVSQGVVDAERKQILWGVGYHLLALGGMLFVALLYIGVYLEVVEASQGLPGLSLSDEPTLTPEATAAWEKLHRDLSDLGFRHHGWFTLDDFDQTHVSAWQHEGHPAAAFVLYSPTGATFRLRIVRRFPSGGILVSSTRLVDLAYPPPQGVYVQVRNQASVKELWAWHLAAETLFPNAVGTAPAESEAGGPREFFVEVSARWAGHRRRDRTWLLAVEPVGECWRMYHLCGMPLSRQFDLGWTTPFWR